VKQTLSVLVENHPGVLSKVAGLFSRRGFNIDSLAVGVTEDPEISRMTIVVDGDERIIEQVSKQLNKLIFVIKVSDVSKDSVMRELALIKVKAPSQVRNDIVEIIKIFRAKVIDINNNTMTIEITGDSDKIPAIENMLRPFGILEVVRTGTVAIERGSRVVKYNSTKSTENIYEHEGE